MAAKGVRLAQCAKWSKTLQTMSEIRKSQGQLEFPSQPNRSGSLRTSRSDELWCRRLNHRIR